MNSNLGNALANRFAIAEVAILGAVSSYVLITIIKKALQVNRSLQNVTDIGFLNF